MSSHSTVSEHGEEHGQAQPTLCGGQHAAHSGVECDVAVEERFHAPSASVFCTDKTPAVVHSIHGDSPAGTDALAPIEQTGTLLEDGTPGGRVKNDAELVPPPR